MKIQTSEKVVDDARALVATVDAIEDFACGLHRQRGDLRTFAISGDCCNTGGDKEGDCFELAKFIDRGIDLLGVRSLRVENGLRVVQDYEHLVGRKEGSQGCQIVGVFDPRADDLGEPGEEMSTRGWELIATDESTVVAKSFFDPIVVENCEGNGCFPDPPCADEGDRFQIFGKTDNLLNQLIPSKTDPWGRGRGFTRRNTAKI